MIVENDIRTIVAEVLEMNGEDIPEDASFIEDLGMDSLRALEILAKLEQKYKIQIPPERLPDMGSLKDCIAVTKEIYEG